jgi:poly(3-hydroxybutyrate) depolymerase
MHPVQLTERFVLDPLRLWATAGEAMLAPLAPHSAAARASRAGFEAIRAFAGPSGSPAFNLDVAPDVAAEQPFGRILHFASRFGGKDAPRYLVIAPLSGHHATLLRPTVDALLDTGDVWLIEWYSADAVSLREGILDYDRYVDHLRAFLHAVADAEPARGYHVLAVCQPGPPLINALTVMSAAGEGGAPTSVSLLGAPMDPGATTLSLSNAIAGAGAACLSAHATEHVAFDRPGAGREIVPGRTQVWTLMAQQPGQHVSRWWTLMRQRINGQDRAADAVAEFYERFGAHIAIDAALYRDTLDRVFGRRELATGRARWRGHALDPSMIRNIGLQTRGGETDVVCAPAETHAAHGILAGIPETRRDRLTAPGLGHYDLFAGRRFRAQILPRVAAFALACQSGDASP